MVRIADRADPSGLDRWRYAMSIQLHGRRDHALIPVVGGGGGTTT